MARINSSVASLRIFGEDLNPATITALLGHAASTQQVKGEVLVGKVTGRSRIAKTGMWRLEATDASPGNLDVQIAELLTKLTDDLGVWEEITKKYNIDLFCGLFMKGGNEGLEISASSLKALGVRGIELALDIYGSSDGDDQEKMPNQAL